MKLSDTELHNLRNRCLDALSYGRVIGIASHYQTMLEAEVGPLDPPKESREETLVALANLALNVRSGKVTLEVKPTPEPVFEAPKPKLSTFAKELLKIEEPEVSEALLAPEPVVEGVQEATTVEPVVEAPVAIESVEEPAPEVGIAEEDPTLGALDAIVTEEEDTIEADKPSKGRSKKSSPKN